MAMFSVLSWFLVLATVHSACAQPIRPSQYDRYSVWDSKRNSDQLGTIFHINRRRQFLHFLANSLQRTGSLRGAIHEIQDMSESKRSMTPASERWNHILGSFIINRSQQTELERSARLMNKWSKARIGKRAPLTDFSSPVEFVANDDQIEATPDELIAFLKRVVSFELSK